jgi:uncharacterized membrane protein
MLKSRLAGLWLACTMTAISGNALAVPSFEVIDLGVLRTGFGGFGILNEFVADVNDNGLVTGSLFDDSLGRFVPALWDITQPTTPQKLQGLPNNSFARRINNNGTIVGGGRNASNIDTGFVITLNGAPQELPVLETGGTRPFAINDQETIAGGADNGPDPQQAFVTDTQGNIQQVGTPGIDSFARDINENGELAGVSGGQAALFDGAGQVTPLDTVPIFTSSDAAALNDTGEVVGFGRLAGGTRHAFYFDPDADDSGEVDDLGAIAGNSQASGINNSSQIVGTTELFEGFDDTAGFLLEVDGDRQMHNLNDLLDQNDPLGPLTNVRQAVAINNLGQVLAIGTRLIQRCEVPSDPTTCDTSDSNEVHGFLLTPSDGNNGGNESVPIPEIFVEASARRADDDAGTQSGTANSGILAIELEREETDRDFPGFDLTTARAEGLITNVGVPTVGSLSQTGGDTGIPEDCDTVTQHSVGCSETSEASSMSRVVSNLQPLFADPDAAPDSIDLDLILNIDGILDIAWFFEDLDVPEVSIASAETSVTAKLHTEDGEIVLFDGFAKLERDGIDSAALTFGGDWLDFVEEGFSITDGSAFADVPDAEDEVTQDGITVLITRADSIKTTTEFVQVQKEFNDIAFLSPGETYALELEISTRAVSEHVTYFGETPQFFKDCKIAFTCTLDDFLAVDPDQFVVDFSFALADMLNTVSATSGSDTDGVSFVTVDGNGNPIPAIGVPEPSAVFIFLLGLVGLGALRHRKISM